MMVFITTRCLGGASYCAAEEIPLCQQSGSCPPKLSFVVRCARIDVRLKQLVWDEIWKPIIVFRVTNVFSPHMLRFSEKMFIVESVIVSLTTLVVNHYNRQLLNYFQADCILP